MNGSEKTICTRMWDWAVVDFGVSTAKMCCLTSPDAQESVSPEAFENDRFLNSPRLMETRKKMLLGERPSECLFCWKLEDAGSEEMSARATMRSFKEYWSHEFAQSAQEVTLSAMSAATREGDLRFTHSHQIKRLQLILSSTCNLKCWYCGEHNSTYWEQYKRSRRQLPAGFQRKKIDESFFRKFLPWLKRRMETGLEEINISGGEPALCGEFYELAEDLKTNQVSNPSLRIDVFSNFGFGPKQKEEFFSALEELARFYKVRVSISMDAYGKRAEFIRDPLVWSRWNDNFRDWLVFSKTRQNLETNIKITLSALNVCGLKEFYQYLFETSQEIGNGFYVDGNVVMDPAHLNPYFLPATFADHLADAVDYLRESTSGLEEFSEKQKNYWGVRMVGYLSGLQSGIRNGGNVSVHPVFKAFIEEHISGKAELERTFFEFFL